MVAAAIRRRVRRTSQPQQSVGINWSNPLARGLANAFVNGVDLVSGLPTGFTQIGATAAGRNERGRLATYQPRFDLAACTIIGHHRYTSDNGDYGGHVFGFFVAGSDCSQLGIGFGNAGGGAAGDIYAVNRANSSGSTVLETDPALPYDAIWGISGTLGSGAAARAYKNGRYLADVAQSGAAGFTQDSRRTVEKYLSTSTGKSSAWMFRWARVLSDAEHAAIAANPWQLLLGRKRSTWVSSSGGSFSLSTAASAAIQATATTTATATAAVQAAQQAQASLQAAVREARTATAAVAAAVQASPSASASVQAAVQQANTATASLTLAVLAQGSRVASLAAAVQEPQLATAALTAMVQAGTSTSASLAAAVQAATSAVASLSVQVQAGTTVSATVDAAVQEARAAVAAVQAAVATSTNTTSQLAAVVAVQRSVAAAMAAAVIGARSATAGMSAYVLGDSALQPTPGYVATLPGRNWVASGASRRWTATREG